MLNTDEHSSQSIKQTVALDLERYATEMKVSTRQVIKDISKNRLMGLRTLERFFQGNNDFSPHVRTLVNIYAQIYDTDSLADIISKAPIQIGEYIKSNHTNYIVSENTSGKSKNITLQCELTQSSIFNQIYIMTGGDHGSDLGMIRKRFGEYGLQELDKLISYGFVEIDEDGRIKRKEKLSWDIEIRKNFAKSLLSDIYSEDNVDGENQNYLSVLTGEVTPEDYKLIRAKMIKDNRETLELINRSKPSYEEAIKFVAAGIMDEIQFKNEGVLEC